MNQGMTDRSGKVDITLYRDGYGGVKIPAQFLVDTVEVSGEENNSDSNTFAGTRSTPNGTYDSPTVEFTIKFTTNLLREVYPEISEDSTDRPTIAGQTVFGGSDCVVREPAKLVVHWTCDGNSDADQYFPNVLLNHNFSASYSPGDVLTVPIMAQVHESQEEAHNGALCIWGTGDLTEPTLFDAETGEYVAVTSS